MNSVLKYSMLTFLLLAVAACTEEMLEEQGKTEAEERVVELSLNVVPESGSLETKALETTTDESGIKDFWLMEFDAAGKAVGVPKYYVNEAQASVPLIIPTGDAPYTVVAIANTHNPLLSDTFLKADEIGKLKALFLNVSRLEDLYTDSGNLLMSGTAEINSDTESLSIDFYRNMARLSLTVSNSVNSGVRVHSVQLRNVSTKLFYADRLWDAEYNLPTNSGAEADYYTQYYTENPAPGTDDVTLLNYPVDDCVLEPGGTDVPLQYYLARNCRGTGVSSTAYDKSRNPLPNSTFIEVIAEKIVAGGTGTPLRYRFYLGEDMIDDYNIVSNHHYKLTIVIDGSGSSLDSRVEDFGSVTLGEANSYIINPLPTLASELQQVHRLPVTDRVNAFWGLGNNVGDANKKIGSTTEWVAEVIWQDVEGKQLISFCNESGVTAENSTGDVSLAPYVYEGKGLGYLYFKPLPDAKGNLVIGVRKKGAPKTDYLWSWHLWITDYAPDDRPAGTAWGDEYVFDVTGGNVHRYDDGTNRKVWSERYKNKYIMDRNLGAMTATRGSALRELNGMAYQFGRKDPFPMYNTKLYNVKGEDLKNESGGIYSGASATDYVLKESGTSSFANSVNKPHTFFYPGSGDWASPNPYNSTSIVWNNPSDYTSETGKSLFDPCPEGWRVPVNYTWALFSNVTTRVENGWSSGWSFYISSSGTNPGDPTAFYPASGYRNVGSGAVSNPGSIGYCWSSSPFSSTYGFNLYFHSSNVSPQNYYYRGLGFPVRCVQE